MSHPDGTVLLLMIDSIQTCGLTFLGVTLSITPQLYFKGNFIKVHVVYGLYRSGVFDQRVRCK